MRTFFAAMWPAFFIRVSPASRNAKPACMNMTSTAVTTTQIVLAAMRRSWFLGTDLRLLQPHSGAVVRHVLDRGRPDEPVARLVAAAGRVRDRVDDRVDDLVGDDERQERLRQEARLEHAPPVLVCDPALPAVPDRLDDRDAYMSGRVLDRVDHRLDALPYHDCLHLHHSIPPCVRTKKAPQEPSS